MLTCGKKVSLLGKHNIKTSFNIACSRLRDSRARWIEKARTQKWDGKKLGREGAEWFNALIGLRSMAVLVGRAK